MLFSLFGALGLVLVLGWDYEEHGEDWKGLCSDGKEQSPINIRKSSADKLGDKHRMEIFYYGTTVSRTVEFKDNNIYIEGDFGYITVRDGDGKDRKFMSNRIVFHAPSEHYFNGYPTHMEMQVFHRVDDSDYTFDFPSIAVVSVMLRPGDNSYFFDSIQASNLSNEGEGNRLPDNSNVNLISIVQTDDDYFFYVGSMNEPKYEDGETEGCEENVLWYVMESQQWVSFIQINYFINRLVSADKEGYRDIFGGSGNTRSIQSKNGRTVYYSASLYIYTSLILILY